MFLLVVRTALVCVLLMAPQATGHSSERPLPGQAVPCPASTADPTRYLGAVAPYRCASAVTDMFGNVVVLRAGTPAAADGGAFGLRHAVEDGNVGVAVIERVVRSAHPRSAPQRRVSYVEQVSEPGGSGAVDVWVAVDRAPSNAVPDAEPFGLLTAYCRNAGHPGAVHRCPDWVNR